MVYMVQYAVVWCDVITDVVCVWCDFVAPERIDSKPCDVLIAVLYGIVGTDMA